MEACGFEESNCVLDKPEDMTHDQCSSLQVWRGKTVDDLPCVVSCWKLTKEEIEVFQKTGRIWAMVVGETMSPLSLMAKYPWSG